jgi:predicted dinucleotide-binding enzyme
VTTIGIIGSGHVGSNLAKVAVAHGYDVVLGNSQGPSSLTGLVASLGPRARAGTPAEAAAAADFAIVAIPITGVSGIPVEPLAGKVVIATINYFPQRDGHIMPQWMAVVRSEVVGGVPPVLLELSIGTGGRLLRHGTAEQQAGQ